jgi:hypothetical protein
VRTLLATCATPRGLLIIAAIAGMLHLAARLYVVPIYREITGFVPFDLQSRLSKFMIAVELGAFDKGAAADIYRVFAALDFGAGIFTALLFAASWNWIFAKAPTRTFRLLTRGGIVLLPAYVVMLDAVAKVGYLRVLGDLSGPSYAATIEFCVAVHGLKFALIDIRNYGTLAIIVIAAATLVRRRRAPNLPADTL